MFIEVSLGNITAHLVF